MDVLMGSVLSQLDYRVVYIFVGVLVISAILSIVKRAIKLGVIVLVIAVATSTLGPMAKSFREDYKFSVDSGIATVQVKGNTLKLDKASIKDIEIVNKGVNGCDVKVVYKEDTGYVTSYINVPVFMYPLIKEYTDKYSIQTTITE